MARKLVCCAATAALMVCCGCGSRAGLYPVSGSVTYHGAPASGAVVYFHCRGAEESKKGAIMGVVHPDGSFELVSGPLGKGAPAGDYDVLIEWTRDTGPGKNRPQTGPDILEGRYADPSAPRFRTTVELRPTKLPPFDLTD